MSDLAFVVPNYTWWEAPFYGIGMKVYDALAGRYGFGKSQLLSSEETVEKIPTIATDGLRGGVQYYDGQFDDARMLVNMAQTAADQGALLVNYCRVSGLLQNEAGFTDGVRAVDTETDTTHEFRAKIVLNCTGPFTDSVRQLDDPESLPVIAPSTGVHIVLPAEFLPRQTAIMVPRTTDGRVLFAIPWHHCVVVGTTDTPIDSVSLEPKPTREEVDFILENARQYLEKPPEVKDVLSVFSGIRPLVKAAGADNTAQLSRDHTILVSQSGLISIAGGKWTTYRHMAEDVIDRAETLGGLESRKCVTKRLNIHGYHEHAEQFEDLGHYGSDALEVKKLVADDPEPVHPELKLRRGEVRWMARREMARTIDDVLSRRSRSILFHAKASRAAAPGVGKILQEELKKPESWFDDQCRQFDEMSRLYLAEELY